MRIIGDEIKPGPKGYSGTLSGFTCKLSTLNGRAFILTPSTSLAGFVNHKITLTAGGKTLIGWIKAPGTGETLGVEKLSNPLFTDNVTGWAAANAATIAWAAGELELTITGAGGGFTQTVNGLATGALYKRSATARSGTYTGDMNFTNFGGSLAFGAVFTPVAVENTYSQYITATGTTDVFTLKRATTATGTGYYNAASEKQVLTPDTSGATIVSAQGGSTFNWTSDDGIDPNSASFTAVISPN